MAGRYQVNSYPTIKIFIPGGDINNPLPYEGERTTSKIEESALEFLKKYPPKREILQLSNETILQKECIEKNGICIVLFVPHILDTKTEGRKKIIATLEQAAKKHAVFPFYYFWSQAFDQKELEKMIHLEAGYPAVVGFSFSKNKYGIMRQAYTVDGVSGFLNDLMRGYERLYDLKVQPKIKTIEIWNGKDAEEPSEDRKDL